MASRTKTSSPPVQPGPREAGEEGALHGSPRTRSQAPAAPARIPAPVRRDGRVPAGRTVPPVHRIPPEPVQGPPPPRRRRVVVGLAAEAAAQAAQAEQAGRGGARGTAGPTAGRASVPARRAGQSIVYQGTCPCGLPASTTCAGGCRRPVCGTHLLQRASRLGWPGPYRSEREHTAYLRGFWADAAPLCAWCREAAGTTALAALPPVAPLPAGAVDRLAWLLRHPHDYPADAWEQTVRQNGGSAAVLRLLAPTVARRKVAQEFEGRRSGEFLAGVSIGGCAGAEAAYEVLDRSGSVWKVRSVSAGVVRKRRVWSWERACEERVAQLLPRVVELVGA